MVAKTFHFITLCMFVIACWSCCGCSSRSSCSTARSWGRKRVGRARVTGLRAHFQHSRTVFRVGAKCLSLRPLTEWTLILTWKRPFFSLVGKIQSVSKDYWFFLAVRMKRNLICDNITVFRKPCYIRDWQLFLSFSFFILHLIIQYFSINRYFFKKYKNWAWVFWDSPLLDI